MARDDSSLSSSSEESEKKRKRKREKLEKKEKKKEKKSKDKKEKKEKKEHKKAKTVCADFPGPAADGSARPKIGDDDYFTKSEEFRVWLHEAKGEFFDEMETSKTRKRFSDFATLWNDCKLSAMYYDGIPSDVRDKCRRTRHKWNFALSDKEKWDLASTKDSIESATRAGNAAVAAAAEVRRPAEAPPSARPPPGAPGAPRSSAPSQRAPPPRKPSRDEVRKADLAGRLADSVSQEHQRNNALADMIREQTGGKRLTIAPRPT
ncbi:hypothetical protein M885DRAFT_513240 [Pelagophyceae sp. CCMP2097]|nr:hypothetical protein M885DRAFT_513240 [Pelagophyceae sp. CCMP2097]